MMRRMDITEFLLARIAEDEAEARHLQGEMDFGLEACGDRMLAECAAKRRIMELYELHRENRDARRSPLARQAEDERAAQDRRTQEARTRVAEDALRSLASVYADHSDYRQEWAEATR